MQALIGVKREQTQKFLENGMRIPVTLIDVKDNIVIAHLTQDKNKYQALQLGFGIKKNSSKAEAGHAKGAKLDKAPKFLREVRLPDESEALPEVGSILNPQEIFAPGDIVNISGFSKGKGFAGGVKRHGFHGGPKTHGQSDRHRAPGAIGSGTTPGRVYRGKRMAGNMGNDNVTIRNLEIIDVTSDGVLVVKGLVPGVINGLIYIKKVGQDKKFVPLWSEKVEETEVPEEAQSSEPASDEAKEESKEETSKEEAKAENSETAKEEVVEAASAEKVKEEKTEQSLEDKKEEVKEDAGK